MMVVAQIGSSLAIIFTSSTLVTEQSFHGFGAELGQLLSKSPSATTAALSKKLYNRKVNDIGQHHLNQFYTFTNNRKLHYVFMSIMSNL